MVGTHSSEQTFDLASKEDSQVECLQIVDISERSHFHFIVRSKSSATDVTRSLELKGTENALEAGDDIRLSTLIVGDKFNWTFSLKD